MDYEIEKRDDGFYALFEGGQEFGPYSDEGTLMRAVTKLMLNAAYGDMVRATTFSNTIPNHVHPYWKSEDNRKTLKLLFSVDFQLEHQ